MTSYAAPTTYGGYGTYPSYGSYGMGGYPAATYAAAPAAGTTSPLPQ